MNLPFLRVMVNRVLGSLLGPPALYFLSSSAFRSSIPLTMASVLEVSNLSAQYCIFCASAVVTRRLIATVRDSSPFGGRPVLGDTQFTSLSRAYIYYIIRAGKSRGFAK